MNAAFIDINWADQVMELVTHTGSLIEKGDDFVSAWQEKLKSGDTAVLPAVLADLIKHSTVFYAGNAEGTLVEPVQRKRVCIARHCQTESLQTHTVHEHTYAGDAHSIPIHTYPDLCLVDHHACMLPCLWHDASLTTIHVPSCRCGEYHELDFTSCLQAW